jgi:hypothetical protein
MRASVAPSAYPVLIQQDAQAAVSPIGNHGLRDFPPGDFSHNFARNTFKFSIAIEHSQDDTVAGDNIDVLRALNLSVCRGAEIGEM